MPQFSVIIPVYNTPEIYLRACVNSVLSQENADYEILLVDDGSSAETARLMDALSKSDGRIRAIHQKNAGVSCARNHGVQEARGEYITFVDADDCLARGFLQAAGNQLAQGASMVIGRLSLMRDNDTQHVGTVAPSPSVKLFQADKEKLGLIGYIMTLSDSTLCSKESYVNRGPATRVVRRQLALDTPFSSHLTYGEDVVWNLQITQKAENVAVLQEICYYYRQHSRSATHRYRPSMPEELEKTLAAYRAFIDEHAPELYPDYYMAVMEYVKHMGRLYFCHPEAGLSFIAQKKRIKDTLKIPTWKTAVEQASERKMHRIPRIIHRLCKYHLYTLLCILFRHL